MTCTEEYKEHIVYTFHAFCRVVIRNAMYSEPEAVNLVLQHYRGYIQYAARISGQADRDAEDYITETLLKALFKFRLDK